jgi:hypothetical protein
MKVEVCQLHKDGVRKATAQRLLQRNYCLLWECGEPQLSYVFLKSRVKIKNPLIPPKTFKKIHFLTEYCNLLVLQKKCKKKKNSKKKS